MMVWLLFTLSNWAPFMIIQVWFQNRRAKFRRNERAMLASKNASLLKTFSGEVTAVEQPIVPRPAPRPNDYLSWGSSPSYRLEVHLNFYASAGVSIGCAEVIRIFWVIYKLLKMDSICSMNVILPSLIYLKMQMKVVYLWINGLNIQLSNHLKSITLNVLVWELVSYIRLKVKGSVPWECIQC